MSSTTHHCKSSPTFIKLIWGQQFFWTFDLCLSQKRLSYGLFNWLKWVPFWQNINCTYKKSTLRFLSCRYVQLSSHMLAYASFMRRPVRNKMSIHWTGLQWTDHSWGGGANKSLRKRWFRRININQNKTPKS